MANGQQSGWGARERLALQCGTSNSARSTSLRHSDRLQLKFYVATFRAPVRCNSLYQPPSCWMAGVRLAPPKARARAFYASNAVTFPFRSCNQF